MKYRKSVWMLVILCTQINAAVANSDPWPAFDPVTAYLNEKGRSPWPATPVTDPTSKPGLLLVFVSLTMPDASLRSLLKQSTEWQAPLLIRGPLPAGFTATAQRLMGLLNAKGALPIRAGVAIDPDAFHRFHVRDVPTFVLIKSNRCQARWPCGPDDHAKIKGNVSIRTALEALSTSPLADVAETLLEAQRDDH